MDLPFLAWCPARSRYSRSLMHNNMNEWTWHNVPKSQGPIAPSHVTLLACPSLALRLHICMTKGLHCQSQESPQLWHLFLCLNTPAVSWGSGRKDDLPSLCPELFDVFSMWDEEPVDPPGACSAPYVPHLGLSHMAVCNICQKHLVPRWLLPQICPWKALAIGSLPGVYVTGWVARRAWAKGSVSPHGDSTTGFMQRENSRGQSTLGTRAGNSAVCHFLLQGISLTQRSKNPGLRHCTDFLPPEPSRKPVPTLHIYIWWLFLFWL